MITGSKYLRIVLISRVVFLHLKVHAGDSCAAIYNRPLAPLHYSFHEYPPAHVLDVLDVQDEGLAVIPVCNKFNCGVVVHILRLCNVHKDMSLRLIDSKIFIGRQCDHEHKVEVAIADCIINHLNVCIWIIFIIILSIQEL
jgi:hypothetical protein